MAAQSTLRDPHDPLLHLYNHYAAQLRTVDLGVRHVVVPALDLEMDLAGMVHKARLSPSRATQFKKPVVQPRLTQSSLSRWLLEVQCTAICS